MRKYILILSISYALIGFAQEFTKSDFDLRKFIKIPSEYISYNKEHLINKIRPDSSYKYWEYIYNSDDSDNNFNRGSIIVSKGDSINYAKLASKHSSFGGFFNACHPGICFNYIVAIRDSNNVEIIDDEIKLTKFIGKIDNLEEVILSAEINGFWFDENLKIGGAYRERTNDYLLYLLELSTRPVTYKSVKAILKKSGKFKVLSRKIYRRTNQYIF